MKKIIMIAIFIVIFLGCIGKNSQTNGDVESGNIYWCVPVINQSSDSEEGLFIKGITKYHGTDVCEAEWKYSGGSVIEYFTEDGKTITINKDVNGIIVNNETVP